MDFLKVPARLVCGAISLSISSHLPITLGSKPMKPVMLPPGLRDTRDEAGANRVDHEGEHDWDCLRCLLQRGGNRPRLCKDHFGPQCDKLFGERLHFCSSRRIAIVDMNVPTLRPPKLSKFLLKSLYVRIVETDEHSDATSYSSLLCARRKRPGYGRATE